MPLLLYKSFNEIRLGYITRDKYNFYNVSRKCTLYTNILR